MENEVSLGKAQFFCLSCLQFLEKMHFFPFSESCSNCIKTFWIELTSDELKYGICSDLRKKRSLWEFGLSIVVTRGLIQTVMGATMQHCACLVMCRCKGCECPQEAPFILNYFPYWPVTKPKITPLAINNSINVFTWVHSRYHYSY